MARIMFISILMICKIIVIIEGSNETESAVIRVGDDAKQKAVAVSTRIIGGSPATIKSYPYAVSVQWRIGSRHHCGGSYIMPQFVLSAAHCMVRSSNRYWQTENPRFFVIIAGTTNLWYTPSWQIMTISGIFPHSGFDYGTMANDIGLYKITRPLQLTAYVGYAPLPEYEDDALYKRKNQMCTVIGWGKTSETTSLTSDTLRHVNVPLISTEDCGRYFSSYLHRSQICAGKKEGGVDACQGDSGGPLLCNNVLIGIVSWGFGCAAPNSPGVYVRVDHYLAWIKRTLLKNSARSTNQNESFMLILFFWCTMAFRN